MDTMRAAVFHGPDDLRVERVDAAICPTGGVLLKVSACCVCGSDVKIARHGHRAIRPPQILGHEVVGRVIESDSPDVPVGQRVQVAPIVGCGQCRWCLAGRPNRCPRLRTVGYELPGGFAELMSVSPALVRQGNLSPVPEDLPDEVAALAEPLACCLNGQEVVQLAAGDHIAILGAGPIGLLHAHLARARGAATVTLVEPRPERRRQAQAVAPPDTDVLAPELAEPALTSAMDVVIVAAPAAEAQQTGLSWLAEGGRLLLFAGLPKGSPPVPLDTNRLHYAEALIAGCHGSTPRQNRQALDLLASGAVRANRLITDRLPLARAPQAVQQSAEGHGLKVAVMIEWPAGRNNRQRTRH